MISIGNYALASRVIMAPMSGCTDLACRLIAREHGARLSFFEMIDAHSVFYHRKKTYALLKTAATDAPIALQLLGRDPEIMLAAAERILSCVDIALLDVNAACPARKVIKKKAGAYLLHDDVTLRAIIQRLTRALTIPITVKIRTAYDQKAPADIGDFAKGLADAGASAISIHGRTRLQYYSGGIDFDAIRRVKESVSIPVFGSGNIFSPQDALCMLERTGCDGVLIARGGLGNPWLFEAIERSLSGESGRTAPTLAAKKAVLKRHLAHIEAEYECPVRVKTGIMRKVAIWYMKSFPLARRMREKICVVNSYQMMLEFIDAISEEGSR